VWQPSPSAGVCVTRHLPLPSKRQPKPASKPASTKPATTWGASNPPPSPPPATDARFGDMTQLSGTELGSCPRIARPTPPFPRWPLTPPRAGRASPRRTGFQPVTPRTARALVPAALLSRDAVPSLGAPALPHVGDRLLRPRREPCCREDLVGGGGELGPRRPAGRTPPCAQAGPPALRRCWGSYLSRDTAQDG
jgi:hypothetical protein